MYLKLGLGTYGNISTREKEGVWTAYARYRDSDGIVRAATRTDTSKTRAVDKLKIALRDRAHQAGSDDISASTKIATLVDLWMESKPGERKFSAGTLGTYEHVIRTVIKPGIGELRIGELTVGRLDRWMSEEHQKRPGRAKTARTVVKQALDMAARRDALAVNPMLAVSKQMKKTSKPRAVTEDELTRLRSAFGGQRQPGPLADMSETMLGLGLRIGEALALIVDDLDLDNPGSPRVRIAATVSQPAGGTLFRQPYPKSGPTPSGSAFHRTGSRRYSGRELNRPDHLACSLRLGMTPSSRPRTYAARCEMSALRPSSNG
ncbi:MAG: hypothetical protein WED09_06390 [Homoserinimonas sp.]